MSSGVLVSGFSVDQVTFKEGKKDDDPGTVKITLYASKDDIRSLDDDGASPHDLVPQRAPE